MNYEPKKCTFCQNKAIHKHGKINNLQRYKCSRCNKTFTAKKSLSLNKIWQEYTEGKQTYKQLAEKYHCSVRTIQRYIQKAPKNTLNLPTQQSLNILADVTFFGRNFGVLVLMDSLSKKVIYHQIVKTEKDVYYLIAINKFIEKCFKIQSITCDGGRGILKNKMEIPTQMCQFHMVAMVMRKLRKKHQSISGNELKIIVKTLKESNKNEFYLRLFNWYKNIKYFWKNVQIKPMKEAIFLINIAI